MIQSGAFWGVLAASAVVYWTLPRRIGPAFLVVAFLAYLSTLAPAGVAALLGWSLLFYFAAPLAAAGGRRGLAVLVGLNAAILGYLAWHKYVPVLAAALTGDGPAGPLVVPLGISYFTFKLIHYAVEVAWGNVTDRSLARFLTYVFLVPTFTAGPIERFDHFLANREDTWRLDSTVEGLTRIAWGLVKAFVVADLVRPASHDAIPSTGELLRRLPDVGLHELWGYHVLSFLYAYVDFSAYSDVAIGASRLYGFRIMENFHFPIAAPNIGEFWRRWHMTLAAWCRSYVYVPMIGRTRNLYAAVYATFVTMGVWHGASINWLLWGLYHATGVAFHLTWTRFKRVRGWTFGQSGPWRLLGVPLTMAFVSGSYAFSTTVAEGPWARLRLLAKLVLIDLPA